MFQRFQKLKTLFEDELAERSFTVCQGTPEDFSKYQRVVGEIQSLRSCIEELETALKEAEYEE